MPIDHHTEPTTPPPTIQSELNSPSTQQTPIPSSHQSSPQQLQFQLSPRTISPRRCISQDESWRTRNTRGRASSHDIHALPRYDGVPMNRCEDSAVDISNDQRQDERTTSPLLSESHNSHTASLESNRGRANTCPLQERSTQESTERLPSSSRRHAFTTLSRNNAPTSTPTSSPTTTRNNNNNNDCLFRHQTLLRTFMLTSLYLTLSYTWKHDLSFRYQSVEINAGLREYWNGVGGTMLLFDGANAVEEEDDLKHRLILGDESVGVVVDDGAAGSNDGVGEKKKKRPSLSHARSLDSIALYKKVRLDTATTADQNSSSSWSLVSRMAWMMACAGFMLPIVEVGWGEARRVWRMRTRLRRGVVAMGSVHDL